MDKIIDAHMHVIPSFCGERNGTPVHGCGYGKVRYSERGNWRLGTKRGERRVMPPSFIHTTTMPAVVLEYMDMAGVDGAILMQSIMYGQNNEYLADLVKKYPDKFIAAFAFVDPRKKEPAIDELDFIKDIGMVGTKIEPPDMPFWLDDKIYDPFWKRMERLNLILSIDLGWDPPENEYNFQIEKLEKVIRNHPELKVIVQHLGVSYLWDEQQKPPYSTLQRTLQLGKKYHKVIFDISGLPEFCPSEEYPFPRAQEIMKVVVDSVGAERIIWGSDFPGILIEDVTYKQTLNIVKNYCNFLSDKDKKMILGGNALELFKVNS